MDLYEFEAPRVERLQITPQIQTANHQEIDGAQTEERQEQPGLEQQIANQGLQQQNHPPTGTENGAETRRISYLDRVRGEQPQQIDVDALPNPVMEGDSVTITLPREVVNRGIKFCEFALIGRLDFHRITLQRARILTTQYIKPQGDWAITPLGKGYFMFRLSNKEEFVRIWAQSWKFDNQNLRFTQWTPDFDPDKQRSSSTVLWVQFPKLKQQYWDYECLMRIGKGVGKPIGVDQRTIKREIGFYANVLIEIDLSKPVPKSVTVREEDGNHFIQEVEIPKLPSICTHCRGVGHNMYQCRGLYRAMQEPSREEIRTAPGQVQQPQGQVNNRGNQQNQWVQVTNRRGNNRQGQSNNNNQQNRGRSTGPQQRQRNGVANPQNQETGGDPQTSGGDHQNNGPQLRNSAQAQVQQNIEQDRPVGNNQQPQQPNIEREEVETQVSNQEENEQREMATNRNEEPAAAATNENPVAADIQNSTQQQPNLQEDTSGTAVMVEERSM
ncbi:hypothetical protein ACHQM5_008605 [Ranunculus cassubicifolius]